MTNFWVIPRLFKRALFLPHKTTPWKTTQQWHATMLLSLNTIHYEKWPIYFGPNLLVHWSAHAAHTIVSRYTRGDVWRDVHFGISNLNLVCFSVFKSNIFFLLLPRLNSSSYLIWTRHSRTYLRRQGQLFTRFFRRSFRLSLAPIICLWVSDGRHEHYSWREGVRILTNMLGVVHAPNILEFYVSCACGTRPEYFKILRRHVYVLEAKVFLNILDFAKG